MSTKKRHNVVSAVSVSRFPQRFLANTFSFLSVSDLASCMRVCRNWKRVIEVIVRNSLYRLKTDEIQDDVIWLHHALRELSEPVLSDTRLLLNLKTYREKVRAVRYAWNPLDASRQASYSLLCSPIRYESMQCFWFMTML